jgi:hypothetical protein
MSEKENPKSDIEEVMRSESRRGKRPVDLDERKRLNELKQGFRDIHRFGTEDDLKDAMRALGYRDDSERFRNALRIWRVTRGL